MSGFLISYSVVVKTSFGVYGFKEYFIDRFSRIFSGLVPSLFVIAILDLLFIFCFGTENYKYSLTLNIKTFLGNLFMLQTYPVLLHLKYFLLQSNDSWLYIGCFGSGRPLWSLAVEWWLYLFFGWLYLNRSGNRNRKFYLLLLFFSVVPVYNVFLGYKTGGLTLVWLMGCAITYFLRVKDKRSFNVNWILCFLCLGLSLGSAFYFFSGYNLISAIFFTFFMYFLVRAANQTISKIPVMVEKLVSFGSGFSFTLYLLHCSVLEYCLIYPESMSPHKRFFAYFVLSNLLSLVIALPTEMKHKKLSSYFKREFLKVKI